MVLSGAVDAWQEQEEEAEKAKEDVINEQDYVYYIYRVHRREWTLDDIERYDDSREEGPEWMECPREYEHVGRANAAASSEVLKAIPGRTIFADDEADYNLNSENIGDGMKLFTLQNNEVGRVEAVVERSLRTYEDRILPQSKDHWRPKDVYAIKQRITKRIVDEVLDDIREEVKESDATGYVYYDLAQANQAAAYQFAHLTYTPDCANLNVHTYEKRQMADQILEYTPEDEPFNMDSGQDEDDDEAEGGKDRVVVWVETVRALGPRN